MRVSELAGDRVGEARPAGRCGWSLDLGLVGQVVADKDDARVAGGLVGGLAKAVGADLAVEDIDVEVGPELLELEGVLDGLGAADAASNRGARARGSRRTGS